MNDTVLLLKTKEGMAAVPSWDVYGVLPDITAPKKRSLIYTSAFANGITIDMPSEDVIGMWLHATRVEDDDDE